jgi:O-6-methylguanine DNA methyltransferase
MTCHHVQMMLEDLTLPRLRAGTYTALHLHVQRCVSCQRIWQQWLHHEQQLTGFFALASAPAGLWEKIMTEVKAHETTTSGDAIWEKIVVEVSPQGLQRLQLPPLATGTKATHSTSSAASMSPLLARARRQLAEYFRGERAVFQLPVDLQHCGDFERAVLAAAAKIPYGEVRSYKWVAEQMGSPRAARAVGNALHKNPLPIVIPCHRVVKSDGGMGGYAFGEAWKTRLFILERDTVPYVGCSTTRIVCYRGCHHERRISDNNRILFVHLNEAIESGYRPCTVCQPGGNSN